MGKCFYMRLAWGNIRRSKRIYLPLLIATAVMSCVVMLINGLIFSQSLSNMPSGETAAMVFRMGISVFCIFTFFFMLYINGFLIKQRKREFGLYGILGLTKHQVGKVLFRENLLLMGGGLILGGAIANIFGRLLFMALIKLMGEVTGGSFVISLPAYLITAALFAVIFIAITLLNSFKVRTASPMELLNSVKSGEKDSRFVIPLAVIGLIMLAAAYYFAWTIDASGIALGLFFPLALLVIIATYALFTSGSIALLRLLRKNKRIYYRQKNFVTISAMFHRMRQNARGLATICILSTMLVVTLSTTLSLYLGREEMLRAMYPFDVEIQIDEEVVEDRAEEYVSKLNALANERGVTLSSDESKLIRRVPGQNIGYRNNVVDEDDTVIIMDNVIRVGRSLVFDAEGDFKNCLSFIDAAREAYPEIFTYTANLWISDIFTSTVEGYGTYGGLLFMGVFFSILFLCMAVLIIYFKQITEGYEDKAQFAILKNVGMDDRQIRATINRQILYVFFLPLAAMLLHMVFAARIQARMLESFMLYDWQLVIACVGGVCAVFAVIYLIVYRLTAKVYYDIVK